MKKFEFDESKVPPVFTDKELNVGWTTLPLTEGEFAGAYDPLPSLPKPGDTVNAPITWTFPDGTEAVHKGRVRFDGQSILWTWSRWLRWIERLWRWKTKRYEMQMSFTVLPENRS